jgi:hypothetical protein
MKTITSLVCFCVLVWIYVVVRNFLRDVRAERKAKGPVDLGAGLLGGSYPCCRCGRRWPTAMGSIMCQCGGK